MFPVSSGLLAPGGAETTGSVCDMTMRGLCVVVAAVVAFASSRCFLQAKTQQD